MVEEKFNDIPIEQETIILSREQLSINNLDCIHEYWSWDGFYAECLIFLKEDVIDLNKEELIDMSSKFWKSEKSEITFSEKGKYVFVNFNFESADMA